MTMWIQLAILGIVAGASFISGWTANGWKHDSEYLARMEGGRIALEATAIELAKLDVRQVTIRQEVERHVIEKPVYRDCKHDPDTLRLLNDAIEGRDDEPDHSELSKTSGSWWERLLRGNKPEADRGQ